jgi:hypothetical protein
VLRAEQEAFPSKDRPRGPGLNPAIEPNRTDQERETRSIPMIPNVNVSQLCEDQPTREAGVGLLASGQARKCPLLDGWVRVAPRRDGCGKQESPAGTLNAPWGHHGLAHRPIMSG